MEFSKFKSSALAHHGSLRASESRPLNLVVLETATSTNDLARGFVADLLRDASEVPDSLLLAYEQTSGRGRRGNSWHSRAGLGIYASLVLAIPSVSVLRSLPMTVGVALASTLDPFCGGRGGHPRVRLKWPNDLLVGGRKVGGVLIEGVSEGDRRGAVIGFGINHGHQEAELPYDSATSVAIESGKDQAPIDLGTLAVELAAAVRRSVTSSTDPRAIVERYREWSAHKAGDRIAFSLGHERLEGELVEIDDEGCLRVDLGSEIRTVASGEVIQGGAST